MKQKENTGERTKQEENHQPNSKTINIQTNKPEWKKNDDHFLDEKNENKMKKMKTQMMIECKNNKIEISRLWLPEILLIIAIRSVGMS